MDGTETPITDQLKLITEQLRLMGTDQLRGLQHSVDQGIELGPTTVISLVAGIIGASVLNQQPEGVRVEPLVAVAEAIVGEVWKRTKKNAEEMAKFERMIKQAGLTKAGGSDEEAEA